MKFTKNDLINKLKSREKVILKGYYSNEKEKEIVKNSSGEVQRENGTITLRIKTNSYSPIQKDGLFNFQWIEKIADGAFDEALKKEKPLFSFLDHKIDIENTIASTADNTLQFEKGDGEYVAKIKLDLSNSKSRDLYEKVKRGVVRENSFIFIPQETEFIENSTEQNVDLEVIHKKGELLSIDPVILAFYPQNEITFNSKNSERKMMLSEEKKDEILTKDDDDKEDVSNIIEDIEKVDEENDKSPEDKVEEKSTDEVMDDDKTNWKEKYLELEKQFELEKQTQKDKDEEDDEEKVNANTPENEENLDGEKIDGEEEAKREAKVALIKKSQNLKETNMNEKNSLQLRSSFIRKNGNSTLNGKWENENDAINYRSKLNSLLENNAELKNEINLLSPTALARAIDGTTSDKGLAYISIINDPEVKTELERVIPEMEGADYVAITTLDEVKKDVMIPSSQVIGIVAEGAASTTYTPKTIAVSFKAPRYSVELPVNPALPNYGQIMESITLNSKNSIITSIRSAFYTNLFAHQNQTLIQVGANYNGGITKDAKVATADNTKLSITDIDAIINTYEAEYGDGAKDIFKILMHPDTLSFIVEQLRNTYHADTAFNFSTNTYRGYKIVTSTMFPNKVNKQTGVGTANQVIAVFVRKDCITARGLNFIIEDNPFIKMSEGLAVRYQFTRGEIKLIDPYLNTRALQIGVVTRQLETNLEGELETDFIGGNTKSSLLEKAKNIVSKK